MQKIIRGIFHADYKYIEQMYMKNPANAFDEAEEQMRIMKNSTPVEYHAMLEQYEKAVMSLIDESGEGDFIVGYQLGVQMLLAAWPR